MTYEIKPHDPTGSLIVQDDLLTECCPRRQWGDGEHDANCPAQAYEIQRAAEPDPRDEDDDAHDYAAHAQTEAIEDARLDRVDDGCSL